MIKCLICNKEFQTLASHINFKHNISKELYLRMYPDAEFISKDLAEKCSARAAKMHKILKEKDPVKYQSVRNNTCYQMRLAKGENFTHTDETKKRMSESHRGVPRKAHTIETKKILRELKIGKPVNLTPESKSAKTEKQKQRWKDRKADTEQFAQYIKNLSEKRLEYIKNHGISLPKRGRKTNIEKRLIEFLNRKNINFIYQHLLEGKFYDFYLPELHLLVEVDGEYWHRFPAAIKNDLEKHNIAKIKQIKLLRITHLNWQPELIFEADYNKIQQHNYSILNTRTKECLNYEISISII